MGSLFFCVDGVSRFENGFQGEDASGIYVDCEIVLLASVDEAKFRRPVRPGDQLRIEMKMVSRKATICKMSGKVTVDGVVVAEATLMCVLRDKPTL